MNSYFSILWIIIFGLFFHLFYLSTSEQLRMTFPFNYIWIIIFGLHFLFFTSTSDDTQKRVNREMNYKGVVMYPNGTNANKEIPQNPGMPWNRSDVKDAKKDMKYIVPVALTLSMLAIPLLCLVACLVYRKCMQTKQPVKDVENPPEIMQPEEKSSETPESSDSFFRCLWKKIMQKIRKKKPKVPDVENPPETTQKLKAAKSSVRKGKRQKKKKKKVAKKSELPVAAQSEAAPESPDSRKHREKVEKIEDHTEQRRPEPESGTLVPINTFSFMESLVNLNEKPTKNQKRKRVIRSMKIEEILKSTEDKEGLLQRLREIKSKSPTAHNLDISVHYEKIEDTYCEEEGAPSLKFELETFRPETLEPLKSEIVIQSIPPPETDKDKSDKQLVHIEPMEDICGDEELLLQAELILLLLLRWIYKSPIYSTLVKSSHLPQQSAEPKSKEKLVLVEPSEDTCGDEELLLVVKPTDASSQSPQKSKQQKAKLCKFYTHKEAKLCKLPGPKKTIERKAKVCRFYMPKKGKVCRFYRLGKGKVFRFFKSEVKIQEKAKVCKFYMHKEAKVCKLPGPKKTIQRKAKMCRFFMPNKGKVCRFHRPNSEKGFRFFISEEKIQEKAKVCRFYRPSEVKVCRFYTSEKKMQKKVKFCRFYWPSKAKVCRFYTSKKKMQKKARVCRFYTSKKTIQKKANVCSFYWPEKCQGTNASEKTAQCSKVCNFVLTEKKKQQKLKVCTFNWPEKKK